MNVVFSVDLFNEGIDVPAVDTLLLLRPTDSPTLFLQQLGRGLRRLRARLSARCSTSSGTIARSSGSTDAFARCSAEAARISRSRSSEGFPFLPAGCHMELDRVATELVLENIREAVPSRWPEKVEELRLVARGDGGITLAAFLDETGLELDDIYTGNKTWSDLRADAGLPVLPAGPKEEVLRRACGRLLHVDDFLRIDTYRSLLSASQPPDPASLSRRERRLVRMLVASVADRAVDKTTSLDDGCEILWAHPQVRAELLELLDVLATRVNHVHQRLARIPTCRCRSTPGTRASRSWPRSGLANEPRSRRGRPACTGRRTRARPPRLHARQDQRAVLADDALPRLRHQSRADPLGEPVEHARRQRDRPAVPESRGAGSIVMLFARLRSDDRAFWFLGPATYVRHESELPMAMTWRLEHPLPGDLFAQFAAAVA